MTQALIGYTGFVGGNLLAQAPYEARFNSRNIREIEGQEFELVVCAGAPAAKWIANQKPDEDWANLEGLIAHLDRVKAPSFILVSTIDVYARPLGVDESSEAFATREANAYGYHRRRLEEAVLARFPGATIIRLPGLFGSGLKKNVIYDFLNSNNLDKIHPDGVFQYYNLDHLWSDIETVRRAGVSVANFAVEPFSVRELARDCFGFEFENPAMQGPAASYDFRTQHSSLWGRTDGYLYGREQVKAELREFVVRQKELMSCV